jgi:hypothetical protein
MYNSLSTSNQLQPNKTIISERPRNDHNHPLSNSIAPSSPKGSFTDPPTQVESMSSSTDKQLLSEILTNVPNHSAQATNIIARTQANEPTEFEDFKSLDQAREQALRTSEIKKYPAATTIKITDLRPQTNTGGNNLGPNWLAMKQLGEHEKNAQKHHTSLGLKHTDPRGNLICGYEVHPDRHPDENAPHHRKPHIHVTTPTGKTYIYTFNRVSKDIKTYKDPSFKNQ